MINDLQNQLQKGFEHLRAEFGKLQMGTANASILDAVEIEMYGSKGPLKNGANVSVMDAKTLKIEPWDKSIMSQIEKGITAANLGLNPQNMGTYIIIPIPPMTEERRKNTVKVVHQESENAKIAVRNIRHDFMKKVKTQKENDEISEDEQKKLEKQIQEKVDESNKNIEELTKKKEKDIMTV